MPEPSFNTWQRKPVFGTQIQPCLVLIKPRVVFPVPSNWTGTEDTRIHHECYPEGDPLSLLVSAGGEEATADIQNPREGKINAGPTYRIPGLF